MLLFATFFDLITRRKQEREREIERRGMRPRSSVLVGWLLRWLCNGNVCEPFLIFSRCFFCCLFCKTGTSTGAAPLPQPPTLPFPTGKCHLTLYFFLYPMIFRALYFHLFASQIMLALALPSSQFQLQIIFFLSFYLLPIASVWWSQVCLSPLSLSLSLSLYFSLAPHPPVNIVLQFNYFSFSCFVFFNRRRRQRQRHPSGFSSASGSGSVSGSK